MASRDDDDVGEAAVVRRFTLLHALRWLPTGLAAPVLILLPHQRGLGLGQIGTAFALYNAVVIVLELPTGGWADRWGARAVLVGSAAAQALGLALLLATDDVPTLLAAGVALGVARALGSGPLEAWAVTSLRRIGADHWVEPLLGRATAIETSALALGALAIALLPVGDLAGIPALAAPVAIATLAALGHLGAVALVLRDGAGVSVTLDEGSAPVRSIVRSVRELPALRRLLTVVALNAIALVAIEMLWQPRFQQLLDLAESDLVRLLGVITAAGYGAATVGAWLFPHIRRWTGTVSATSTGAQLLQVAALVTLALATQPGVAVAAFVVVHLALGSFHPAIQAQLHGFAADEHRTTMISAGSLTLQVGAVTSQLGLTALAGVTSIPTAWLVATGCVLVAATVQRQTGTAPARRPVVATTSGATDDPA